MVRSCDCDIINCGNNSKTAKGISYHQIPCYPTLRSQWLNSIGVQSGFKENNLRSMT